MTPRMKSLLDDATAAGYAVTRDGSSTIVSRRRKVNASGKTRLEGIEIYEDGTAILLGVDLAVCKGMRSYKAMRSVLGLKKEAAR